MYLYRVSGSIHLAYEDLGSIIHITNTQKYNLSIPEALGQSNFGSWSNKSLNYHVSSRAHQVLLDFLLLLSVMWVEHAFHLSTRDLDL